jgi:hypothetical protein
MTAEGTPEPGDLLPGDVTAEELVRMHEELAQPGSSGYRDAWNRWHAVAMESADPDRGKRITAYLSGTFSPPEDDGLRPPVGFIIPEQTRPMQPSVTATNPSGRFQPGPGGPRSADRGQVYTSVPVYHAIPLATAGPAEQPEHHVEEGGVSP